MPDPSNSDLIDSVLAAGLQRSLDITRDPAGALWISGRGGAPVDPPVEIRFTGDALSRYYRDIAEDPGRGEMPPWDWWRVLMSTHLYEALHQLDRIDGPAVVVIGRTGFTARPADVTG